MRYFFLLIILILRGIDTQLEWDCSSLTTDGVHYFPNLMTTDSLSPNTGWTNSMPGQIDIYPVPEDLFCTGTVTAVEFCYKIENNLIKPNSNSAYLVFTLSTLTQNSSFFKVEDSTNVSVVPRGSTCEATGNPRICCATATLGAGHQLSFSGGIAIGIIILENPTATLQRFASMNTVTVYQQQVSSPQSIYNESNALDHQFQVFRLHITPLPPTTSSTTMSTSFPTTVATNVDMTSDTPDTDSTSSAPTNTESTSSAPTNTESISSAPTNTKSISSAPTNTESISSAPTNTENISSAPTNTKSISSAPTNTEISSTTMHDSEDISTSPVMSDSITSIQKTTKLPNVSPDDMPSSTSSTNAEMRSDAPPRDDGLNNSAPQVGPIVGGALGGVIALLLAVIMAILLLMVCRGRKSFKREDDGKIGTISNAIYDFRDLSNSETSLSKSAYDYAEVGPNANGSSSTSRKQGEEVYYSAVPDEKNEFIPQEYEDFQTNKGMTLSNPMEYDDIYIAPASDMNGLYAQLEDILSDDVCRQNIRLGQMLGSGQFGEVYGGVWERSHNNLEVAVKTLKKGSSEDDKVKFLQEAAIMGQFKHPNVVTMYGVVTDGEPVLLVLEMLKNGDLRTYLLSMRTDNEGISDEIDDHELLSYCRQIASGMVYLSNKAFVHRDLAARNILVSDDGICKIADFGMSRDLADENYYVSHGGKIPVKWTAPEALYYKKYSSASDVWSFGVVMYEIWSVGYKPFNQTDNAEVISLVTSGYRLPPPPGCPRAIYSIMMSCWHPKADSRPNFNEVSTQLSVSNSKLLHWTEEDKSKFPDASKLGASLNCSENLYKDTQFKYKNNSAKFQLRTL